MTPLPEAPVSIESPATPHPDSAPARLNGEPAVLLTDVVPAPTRVRPDPAATFTLRPDTTIRCGRQPGAVAVAEHLAELLRPATGYPLPVGPLDGEPPGDLRLLLTNLPAVGTDGYRLTVTPTRVTLAAPTPTGLFHGVQTLRQLLPWQIESRTPVARAWTVPGGEITDTPRFAYRGAMLDVARHFFDVPDVLRFIDHLARYKLNHLHLHLTDDQGWRIAIDRRPALTRAGAATQVGGGEGGYYSKSDYRRIVRYAAAHHITVVPEVDMPGHTHAALTAYRELAPDDTVPAPYTGTEVGFSSLALDRETTYEFLADVLGELAELTPGPYLHIGGDEAFHVPGPEFAAFVTRAQSLVAATGKIPIGWHQLAAAEHRPGRILQYWGTSGEDPLLAAAVRRGDRVILSPADRCYLDMKYDPQTPIGHDWAGTIDVQRAYDWDPESHLDGVPAGAVLGLEMPLWTESVTTMEEIEFMLFPRLPALAELAWSPRSARDWPALSRRLTAQAWRWTEAGITFHRAPELPWPVPAQRRPDSDSSANSGSATEAGPAADPGH
ncbi:beta-N-acetylhexosaminidase [Melissospora conviva]|uniref:beta-N-acetylhexosaminidase n=1 Tax=Melissospora conviva TaxID=3388432 RepID=UPI003B76D791